MKMKKLIAILLVLALIAADMAAIAEGILTLPKALKVIEEEAFSGTTGVEKIVVPEGTTEIKSRAFAGSSAKEIELPSTLTNIADDAFEDSSIENVIVPDGCYAYDWTVERGYILDRVPTPAEFFGTEELDDGTLCIVDYTGEDKTIVIPNSIGGKNVTQIGDSAFESLGLISVAIPEGITRIGEAAFGWNWDLKLAPLPVSLMELGDYAFNQCNLRSIELPEGLQIIGNCAFGGNEYVESIHIPANVDYIGDGVFYDCFMLESITLAAENDAYEIVDEVLLSKDGERLLLWLPGKDDAEYVVPDGVIEIVDHAFDGVDVLERIILPESLCILGDCAFRKCVLLESIVIPDACTTIEGNVFEGCASLMEIVLPNGLEGISWASFADCTSLVRAFLPQSIRWIQGIAFDNCTALTTINLPKGISFIEDSAFDNCPNLTITVVEGSYALEWCESHEGINCTAVPDTAPEVPSHPDYTLEVLEDGTLAITGYTGSDYYLEIPQEIGNVKVTAIAAEAFANCESLGSVVIPRVLFPSKTGRLQVVKTSGMFFSRKPLLNWEALSLKEHKGIISMSMPTAGCTGIARRTIFTAMYPMWIAMLLKTFMFPAIRYNSHSRFRKMLRFPMNSNIFPAMCLFVPAS